MKKAILIGVAIVSVVTAVLYGLGKTRKTNEQAVDLTPGKEKTTGQVEQPDNS